MNLYINNVADANKLITFNNVPTLLRIQDRQGGSGVKARLELTVSAGGNTESECYIRINGYTITSTNVLGNDVSSVYLVPYGEGASYVKTSAYSIVRAFQNTGLINNYNIYVEGGSVVVIEAKEFGSQYNFTQSQTNASYITMSNPINGSSPDTLTGTKVILDIYATSDGNKQSTLSSDGVDLPHLMTIEKNYYKNEIVFDLSPVLATITENGNVTEYNIVAHYKKDYQMGSIGELRHNYCTNGYSVNQGNYFIPKFTGTYLAQNVRRGTNKATFNNSILYYVDGEQITLSFYCENLITYNMTINYLDSALNTIKSSNVSFQPIKTLHTYSFIPEEVGAYYIDVITPHQGTVRYTNIKPLKYGNSTDYQVIYWHNSYGGVSFVPLTFNKEEERETEIEQYKKQSFDLYSSGIKELNKVYNRSLEYQVTMTSHYMPKDGVWTYYDLLHSYSAWTYINGVKYGIIITNVTATESNVNDVWQVSVTYKYSVPDVFY